MNNLSCHYVLHSIPTHVLFKVQSQRFNRETLPLQVRRSSEYTNMHLNNIQHCYLMANEVSRANSNMTCFKSEFMFFVEKKENINSQIQVNLIYLQCTKHKSQISLKCPRQQSVLGTLGFTRIWRMDRIIIFVTYLGILI